MLVGDEYSLQADDQDGNPDTGWITIKILEENEVAVETVRNIPSRDSDSPKYVDTTYRFATTQAEHPLVFQAILYLALAFRADSQRRGSREAPRKLTATKNRKLKQLYGLLDGFTWLPTITCKTYLVEGDSSPWPKPNANCSFGVMITETNDDWLKIGYTGERFRNWFGGGIYRYSVSALRILAEAIRLEQEGSSDGR